MVVAYRPHWEEFARIAGRIRILYAAASLWAEKVGWRPGDDDR